MKLNTCVKYSTATECIKINAVISVNAVYAVKTAVRTNISFAVST